MTRTISGNMKKVLSIFKNYEFKDYAWIPHTAFTKDSSAIAVDARSPVMERNKNKDKHKCSLETESMLAGCIGMKP